MLPASNMNRPTLRPGPRVPVRATVAALFGLALGVSACAPTNIPNTDVEDSSKNRKVVSFCEQYRHAVEEKNVGLLLKLAHERYFEDGGNTSTDDDIDYSGLQQYLTSRFTTVGSIRYEIRYRRITFRPDDRVYVDYTYSASYKIPGVSREEWRHTVADNRLELEPDAEKKTFKIVAGM